MDKDILLKSKLHKTFVAPSRGNLDLTYVITTDGSFVITTSGAYVVVGQGVAKKNLLSLIGKGIISMAGIEKILIKATKIIKTFLLSNRFSKIILKKSKIKKEKELDG